VEEQAKHWHIYIRKNFAHEVTQNGAMQPELLPVSRSQPRLASSANQGIIIIHYFCAHYSPYFSLFFDKFTLFFIIFIIFPSFSESLFFFFLFQKKI
jgi:hypothetical protein